MKNHVNPSKIYINSGILVHLSDLFSEIPAPMILKFHMQHDKAAGPQKNKIQAAQELVVVVVALLFYVHGKHLRSCRDGQLT